MYGRHASARSHLRAQRRRLTTRYTPSLMKQRTSNVTDANEQGMEDMQLNPELIEWLTSSSRVERLRLRILMGTYAIDSKTLAMCILIRETPFFEM